MISLPPSPEKPQCVHKNDADNCLLCGTKKLKGNKYNVQNMQGSNFQPPPIPIILPALCHHGLSILSCLACEVGIIKYNAESARDAEQDKARRAHVDAINARSVKLWDEIRREEFNTRWPGGKCFHGVYLNEFYCGICSFAIIDPDYNSNIYRTAITKALGNARRVLRSNVKVEKDEGFRPKKSEKDEDLRDENVNFEDLRINVDLEIWRATKKYGNDMNEKLAFTVARNTAQKFLADLIAEQTVFVGLDLEFATPKDREDAERLLFQCEDEQALELLANDGRANPEDRQTAQRLINEYGDRGPRFASMDDTVVNEKGEKGGVSAAETEIHEKEEQDRFRAPDAAEILEEHHPALAALVATWRGDQRKVGEAMLAGGFNVRNIPGVSKSQAGRLYSVVVRAFKALIANALTK